MPQQVRLTYVDGSTLDTIGQVNRTNVPLADVPVPVRDAVLAASVAASGKLDVRVSGSSGDRDDQGDLPT